MKIWSYESAIFLGLLIWCSEFNNSRSLSKEWEYLEFDILSYKRLHQVQNYLAPAYVNAVSRRDRTSSRRMTYASSTSGSGSPACNSSKCFKETYGRHFGCSQVRLAHAHVRGGRFVGRGRGVHLLKIKIVYDHCFVSVR